MWLPGSLSPNGLLLRSRNITMCALWLEKRVALCANGVRQMLGRELDALRMRSFSPDVCAAWPPPSSLTTFFPFSFPVIRATIHPSISPLFFPFASLARPCARIIVAVWCADVIFERSSNMNHASDIPSESDRWRLNCTATFVFLRLSGYVLFTCIKYVTCIIYLMIHIRTQVL